MKQKGGRLLTNLYRCNDVDSLPTRYKTFEFSGILGKILYCHQELAQRKYVIFLAG